MSPPHTPKSHRDEPDQVRRNAPLNSVSTRIILCVFGSTLLTAMIVSWLSIGAIHRDVRARVSHRSALLAEERAAQIERWHAEAEARLGAAVEQGTSWRAQLDAVLEDASREPVWLGEGPLAEGDSVLDALPPPPPALARSFDRLSLHRSDAGTTTDADCLSARTALRESDGETVGHLVGCLHRSSLYEFLRPPTRDTRGLRILAANDTGRVFAAAGLRAEARLEARLPIAQLLAPQAESLAIYRDPSGKRLVASLAPLTRSGGYLIAESEYDRAFAPAIAITNQIFIVDVCIILLFSVLAYKITRAIMQPIEALSQGARRIASGQVDYQIPLPANDDDELGLLTRAFNSMMGKLRSNQLEIEQDRIRLAEKNEELQRANEILAQLSITDGLTKLHNHRYFQDHLSREVKRVSRTKAPLSLILLDIDDFKLLNDTHGHAAGDEVLISLASIMNDSARESDLIARYGGEEFVILMPNTDLAGAVHLAEKIRMTVESTRLIIGDNMKPVDITISLGVALYKGNRREFFAEADRALYRAKGAGKNCVIIAGSETGASD